MEEFNAQWVAMLIHHGSFVGLFDMLLDMLRVFSYSFMPISLFDISTIAFHKLQKVL